MKFPKRKFPDGEFWWCEKHKQRFMLFLHDCPICAGEQLARDNPPYRIDIKPPKPKRIQVNKPIKRIRSS